ncbi:MAG: sodium-dependent transporter [Acidiferrobacterales bacterium]
MPANDVSIHGEWSSRMAFVLAATGSAVGLGNIWKFPYITGENGGGAFVLVYLISIGLIGVPIMMAEVMLGRRGRLSPINTMRKLAKAGGHSSHWQWLGWAGVFTGFLILSYYSVIAGWALSYTVRAASGEFTGADADTIKNMFTDFISSPLSLLGWHTLFIVMTMVIVSRGVRGGLEKAVKLLMPALFILLILLVGYAINTGAFSRGVEFLFYPDFSRIGWNGILIAMGHAFFTLSLGMGSIMVYGSYLPKNISIAKTTFLIAGADTLVALMAGMVIFPIVFANELHTGSGPGLIFQTLPIAFGNMWGGFFFGTLFFILLVFAAWTSAISLIEPAVAWLVENHNMTRRKASVVAGFVTWFVGIGTVLSFNLAENITLFGKTFFDLLDYLTANIMLPLGGFVLAIFATWALSKKDSMHELEMGEGFRYSLWFYLVKFVAPIAVLIVFLNVINVINL